MTKLVADPNMKNLKIGDTYKGGKVINMGTMPAFQSGSRGWAKLPVKPELIGKAWVVVKYSPCGETYQYISTVN